MKEELEVNDNRTTVISRMKCMPFSARLANEANRRDGSEMAVFLGG
jgi:hypothetical protein